MPAFGFGAKPFGGSPFPTTRILPDRCTVSHLIACADGTYDVVDTHISYENGPEEITYERPTLQSVWFDQKEE